MRLDDATAELLAGSLRSMFATAPADLGAALDELGWDEVAADDPARSTTLLFTEHGRARASSALLDRIVLAELPTSDASRAVLYPAGSAQVLLTDPKAVDEIVVPSGDGFAIVAAADVTATPASGFGDGSGWYVVDTIDAGAPVADAASVERAIAAARRAVAAELIGLCEVALEKMITYTTSRHQYGRAIGSFQAVRHRVAEAHVAVVSARHVLAAAWDAGDAWTAGIAKARTGRAQAAVMAHLIQFHGAIGLSLESDVHRYVTRAASLDLLLGSHAELGEQLGRDLLAGADVAPVVTI